MTINVSDKLIYLAAGCGIGAVLGVLFAPESGLRTRHNLTTKMDDLTHKVQDKVHQSGVSETASQTWHNVVERSKNVAGNVASIGRQRLNDSIEAGKRRFNESIEDDDLIER
jgi:gas vesicle protein